MSEACCRVDFIIEDCAPVPFLITDGDGTLEMELADPVIRASVYPEYDGPLTVVPSPQEQVLETRFRTVTDRITVAPIPQNYGLITYNGRTITVS